MAELRDLYDINSNKTDKTYHKGDAIPDGYYPMVVMVVIRNSNGEFLMQKRVESKGGDWGVTGGHPKSGETPIEGIITEVKEELGLDFSKEKFIEYNSGCDGRDCYKGKDNEEFLKKLDLIMSSDNTQLVKNGYKLVEERTLEKVGQELKQAYENLLEKFKKNTAK